MNYKVNIFDIDAAAKYLKENNSAFILDTVEDIKIKIQDRMEELIQNENMKSISSGGITIRKGDGLIRITVSPQFSSYYYVEAEGLDF